MSGFYTTFLIIIAGITLGLIALAYGLQYVPKFARSPSLIMILRITAIVFVILWSVLVSVRPTGFKSLEPMKGALEKEAIIGGSSDLVNGFYGGNGGGSFGVYLNLSNYERTAMVGGGRDSPLVRISGTRLYVNNNADGYTTYMEVDTVDSKGVAVKERIPIDDFPMQKWVYLTINREGRRYTAYYNGTVAGSKVTNHMYVTRPDSVRIGGPSYRGVYVYPTINASIMREEDIERYMSDTSDTKHQPILPQDFWGSITSVGIFCKDGEGMFCGSSAIQTPSGLKWDTQFG